MSAGAFLAAVVLCSAVALAAGPKYKKPEVTVPPAWQSPVPWQTANPSDALPKDAWWTVFGDSELNQYEDRATANNQTLKAPTPRLAEAQAFPLFTSSALSPYLDAPAFAQRHRLPSNT